MATITLVGPDGVVSAQDYQVEEPRKVDDILSLVDRGEPIRVRDGEKFGVVFPANAWAVFVSED